MQNECCCYMHNRGAPIAHIARAVSGVKRPHIPGPLGYATVEKEGYGVRWTEWRDNSPTSLYDCGWFAYIVLTIQHRVNHDSPLISSSEVASGLGHLLYMPSRGPTPTGSIESSNTL